MLRHSFVRKKHSGRLRSVDVSKAPRPFQTPVTVQLFNTKHGVTSQKLRIISMGVRASYLEIITCIDTIILLIMGTWLPEIRTELK